MFLEDYIYNLSKTSIDKSQPLWDLHLFNLRSPESEAVGVFRLHHSFGDGTSLMSLLLACIRQTKDPLALPTIPVKMKQEKKDDDRWFWRIMFMLWSLFQVFRNTVVDVFMFIATTLFLKDTQNPLKGPPRSEFNPRRIVYRAVRLDDIKLTINDVALGITQAGLSRYINRIYGTIHYTMFVDRKKRSFEAIFTFSIAELALKIFGVKTASTLSHRILSHTTMSFSNLVGPLEEIGFYGHPLAFLAPSSYSQPHALMTNFQSYIDKMAIVLSVDDGTNPNPHQLCEDIVESLRLIKDAVVTRGLA
ncbi:putative CAP [Hibiscus syriacus]|uniref:CAP n=1 Tax=Hibiscus syriacus TaxID=106335 RepID=A0A6A2WY48_HIBSY|nr:putative CAP [Hibiscus syriacus]